MDKTFSDQQSISLASDGGVESPGYTVNKGSRRPMSGTPWVKKSSDSRKGIDMPQPSTASFSEDAFSITRFILDKNVWGDDTEGGGGTQDPGNESRTGT